MGFFDQLPPDAILSICQALPFRDLEALTRVNREVRRVVAEACRVRVDSVISHRHVHLRTRRQESAFDFVEYSRRLQLPRVDISHDRSMTTGRSLLLNRMLRVPDLMELHFGRDSYMSILLLSDCTLETWRGRRVLDIGSGLSIFASEAAVLYGITVDRVDLNAAAFTDHAREAVVQNYIEGMAVLIYMAEKYPGQLAYLLGTDAAVNVIKRIQGQLLNIVLHYARSASLSPALAVDAAAMSGSIATDAYDVVLCSWVLMYLDKATQKKAMGEMVRVTRVGGQIRIVPGDSLARRHTITNSEVTAWAKADGKQVTVSKYDLDGLMILDVIGNSNCVVQ